MQGERTKACHRKERAVWVRGAAFGRGRLGVGGGAGEVQRGRTGRGGAGTDFENYEGM
jgi:hypothetical protein